MGAGASMISDDAGKLAVSRNTNPVATSFFDNNYQRERAELRKKMIQSFQKDPQFQTINKQIAVVRSLLIQHPEICATASRESEVELDLLPTNFIAAHHELDRLLTLYETNIILKSTFCRIGNVACPLGHHAAYVENMRPLSTKDNPLHCNICNKEVKSGYHCSYCCYNLCQPCSAIYCCNGHAMKLWTHPESDHHCIVCNSQPITSGYRCVECEQQNHEDYNICDMCTYHEGRKKVQKVILDRLAVDLQYLEAHMSESEIAFKTITNHRKKIEENSYSTTKELYDFSQTIHHIQQIAVREVQQTRITRVIQRLRNKLFMGKDICLTAKNEYEHNLNPVNNNNYTIRELIRLLSLEDWSDFRKSLRVRNSAYISCPLSHAMNLFSSRPLPYCVKANPAALKGIESKIAQGVVDIRYEDVIILDVLWEDVQSALASVIMTSKNYLTTPVTDIEAEEEKSQREKLLAATNTNNNNNNNNNESTNQDQRGFENKNIRIAGTLPLTATQEKYDDEVLNHWLGVNTVYNSYGNFLVVQQSAKNVKKRKNDVVLTMLENLLSEMKRGHDEKRRLEREAREKEERRRLEGDRHPGIYGEENDDDDDEMNSQQSTNTNKKQYRKRELVKKKSKKMKNKSKRSQVHPIDGEYVSETTSVTSGTNTNTMNEDIQSKSQQQDTDQDRGDENENDDNNHNDINNSPAMDIITLLEKTDQRDYSSYKQQAPPPKCAVCGRVAAPKGCYCDYCDYALCSLCSVVYCFDGHAMKMWTEPLGSLETCFLCKKTGLTSGYRCTLCAVDLCDLCTTKTARGKVRRDWEKEMHTLIDFMKSVKHQSDIAKYYEWRALNQIISTGQLVDYVHELRTAKVRVEKQVQQKSIIDKIKLVRAEVIKRADLCKAAARESIRNEAFVYASKTQAMQELKRLVALLKAMMTAQTQEYRARAGIACPLGHGMVPVYKRSKRTNRERRQQEQQQGNDQGSISYYIHDFEEEDGTDDNDDDDGHDDDDDRSLSSQQRYHERWKKESQQINDGRSLTAEHGSVLTNESQSLLHTEHDEDLDEEDVEEGEEALEADEVIHELLHGEQSTKPRKVKRGNKKKRSQQIHSENTSGTPTEKLPAIAQHQPIGEVQQQIFQPLKSSRQQLDNLLSAALQPPKPLYHSYQSQMIDLDQGQRDSQGPPHSSSHSSSVNKSPMSTSKKKSGKDEFTIPAHTHLPETSNNNTSDQTADQQLVLRKDQNNSSNFAQYSYLNHQQKEKRSCQVCGCKIIAAKRPHTQDRSLPSLLNRTSSSITNHLHLHTTTTSLSTPSSKKNLTPMEIQPPVVPVPQTPYTCPICEYDLCPDCCTLYCRNGHPLRIWTLPDAHCLTCDLCKQTSLTAGYRCLLCETDICDLCTTRDSRNAFLLWPRRELHKLLLRYQEVQELSDTARKYLVDLSQRHPDKKYLESISKLWVELNQAKQVREVIEVEVQTAVERREREILEQSRLVGKSSKGNLKSLLPASTPFFGNIQSLLDDLPNNQESDKVLSLPSLSSKNKK